MPDDPAVIGVNLLDIVRTGYADADVPLPVRQVLAVGPLAAWDSAQVTVALVRVYPGLPGADAPTRGVPVVQETFTGQYRIEIVRAAAATVGNQGRRTAPSAASLFTDARTAMQDMLVLSRLLHTARKAGTITGRATNDQMRVRIQPVMAAEPQGGLFGTTVDVDVLLA